MNLAVQEALDHDFLESKINKLRMIIIRIRKTDLAIHALEDLAREDYQKPVLDVKTRWNSTYEMLKCSLKLKNPINGVCASTIFMSPLSEEDWEDISLICDLLEPFYESTNEVASEKNSSIAMLSCTISVIMETLDNFDIDRIPRIKQEISEIILKMKIKMGKQ